MQRHHPVEGMTLQNRLGIAAVFIFIISSQPYSAVFSFTLLIIKLATLIKRQ
jgi:hypothetical protein